MDTEDASSASERRPTSSLLEGVLSQSTTSGHTKSRDLSTPPLSPSSHAYDARPVPNDSLATLSARLADFHYTYDIPSSEVLQRSLELSRLTENGRNLQPFESEIWKALTALIFDSCMPSEPTGGPADVTIPSSTLALELMSNTIRFNSKWLDPRQLRLLLDAVVFLAARTARSADLVAALVIFDACLTYTRIPRLILQGMMDVVTRCYYVGSRMNKHKKVAARAWVVMKHLLLSDLAKSCIDALIDQIGYGDETKKDMFGSIVGSLMLLEDKLLTNKAKDWPDFSVSNLVKCLLARAISEAPVLLELIISLASRILGSGRMTRELTLDNTWEHCGKLIETLFLNRVVLRSSTLRDTPMVLYSRLIDWTYVREHMQTFSIADVCLRVAEYVEDDEVAIKLLDFCREEKLLHHYTIGCYVRFHMVANKLLHNLSRSSGVRRQAAVLLSDSFVLADDPEEGQLLLTLLVGLEKETDIVVLEQLALTATSVLRSSGSLKLLEVVLGIYTSCIHHNDWLRASAAVTVTRAAITLFLQYFGDTVYIKDEADATQKAIVLFKYLQDIALPDHGEVAAEARVAALKLLFRIRSDVEGKIHVLGLAEGEDLAANLSRTVISTKAMARDQKTSRPSISTTASREPVAWMYGQVDALPEAPPTGVSRTLVSSESYKLKDSMESASIGILPMGGWLRSILEIVMKGADWEVYSYTIVHLGAQLSNHSVLADAVDTIRELRSVLCGQLSDFSFVKPPPAINLKKADIAVCLYQSLTMMIGYHHHFSRSEKDEIVKTFLDGIGSAERTSIVCVHALTICCYELPNAIISHLGTLLQRMAQAITQSHVAVHILEFLASLSRMPGLYRNFIHDDLKRIFGICFRYLSYFRDEKDTSTRPESRASSGSSRTGASVSDTPAYPYALAYHVVTFWYINLKPADREAITDNTTLRQWIVNNLAVTDEAGSRSFDDAAIVVLDMMARIDATEGQTQEVEALGEDVHPTSDNWLFGLLLITMQTDLVTGRVLVTYRQASGTTHEAFRLAASPRESDKEAVNESMRFLPSETREKALQLIAPHILDAEGQLEPSRLPSEDRISRAIDAFDRVPALDSHKVGVIYVGEDQTKEADILANEIGSPDYNDFVHGLGTLVALKNADFYTHGLDRTDNLDGEHTIVWHNTVTELVFHITTYMPTNREIDPLSIQKKKHIGNNFVNVVFNNSGSNFDFGTFPSQFNYVYIVISPSARTTMLQTRQQRARPRADEEQPFYKIQVMSQAGFPDLSSAAEAKIISGTALPEYVRNLALSACVFALVWQNEQKEYPSSWRSRLRYLRQLRDRHGPRET